MLAVDLVALEAKGPHCTISSHSTGGILSLDDAADDSEGQGYLVKAAFDILPQPPTS
jgi:hypothetical protein